MYMVAIKQNDQKGKNAQNFISNQVAKGPTLKLAKKPKQLDLATLALKLRK